MSILMSSHAPHTRVKATAPLFSSSKFEAVRASQLIPALPPCRIPPHPSPCPLLWHLPKHHHPALLHQLHPGLVPGTRPILKTSSYSRAPGPHPSWVSSIGRASQTPERIPTACFRLPILVQRGETPTQAHTKPRHPEKLWPGNAVLKTPGSGLRTSGPHAPPPTPGWPLAACGWG